MTESPTRTIALNFVVALATLTVALAAVHWSDIVTQDELLARSEGDPRVLAQLLSETDREQRQPCAAFEIEQPSELDVLMSAIATVERFATSRIERLAEWLIIRGAVMLNVPVPNLSVGDGQIRVSTAVKIVREVEFFAAGRHLDRNTLALGLLSRCDNHRLGVGVLVQIAKEQGLRTDALDRPSILTIAAVYNGQAESHAIADFVAKQTYNELVYHLFHSLKFSLLQMNTGAHPNNVQ